MKFIRLSFVMVLLFGLAYPILMTGIAQLFFPHQAEGSMIQDKSGKVIGSEWIGQNFQSDRHFHNRVSSIKYDASGSGSNNYAPSNKEMIQRTEKEAANWIKKDPENRGKEEIPLDLVTNSGSGLDPHITPEAARYQIPRVAKATGLSEKRLALMVSRYTDGRDFGIFGEPRVNVMKLNQAIDGMAR